MRHIHRYNDSTAPRRRHSSGEAARLMRGQAMDDLAESLAARWTKLVAGPGWRKVAEQEAQRHLGDKPLDAFTEGEVEDILGIAPVRGRGDALEYTLRDRRPIPSIEASPSGLVVKIHKLSNGVWRERSLRGKTQQPSHLLWIHWSPKKGRIPALDGVLPGVEGAVAVGGLELNIDITKTEDDWFYATAWTELYHDRVRSLTLAASSYFSSSTSRYICDGLDSLKGLLEHLFSPASVEKSRQEG